MPPISLSIRFTSDDVHKIRNFCEDLASTLRDRRLGSVGDIDGAIDEIVITLASRRNLGEGRTVTRQLLAKHHLAEVSEVSGP
jgi:hypothetical protein